MEKYYQPSCLPKYDISFGNGLETQKRKFIYLKIDCQMYGLYHVFKIFLAYTMF